MYDEIERMVEPIEKREPEWWKIQIGMLIIEIRKDTRLYSCFCLVGKVLIFSIKTAAVYLFLKYVLHI